MATTAKILAEAQLPTGDQVLVVEDELRIRTMLSAALKGMGFHATLAPTAEAALKELAARSFDIVILDLNLPGMDGLEFLRRARAGDGKIQVIILTGFGDLEAAKTAIHLDVVEFLTKPCTLGNLEVALDRARKRRRALFMSELPVQVVAEEEEEEELPAVKEPAPAEGDIMDDVERRTILQTLKKHGGNRAQAAAELGISLRKLYYRLKQYERRGEGV